MEVQMKNDGGDVPMKMVPKLSELHFCASVLHIFSLKWSKGGSSVHCTVAAFVSVLKNNNKFKIMVMIQVNRDIFVILATDSFWSSGTMRT
jgi:hypothetical protein